jgi:uncharacterized Zn-finger protein
MNNLTFDLEELFSDDLFLLSRSSLVSSDESLGNGSVASYNDYDGMSNVSSSIASYRSRASYNVVQSSRWDDDRLEWMKLVDKNEDGKFKCPKCSRLYTRKANLKAHFASAHIGIKRFECPRCSKLFVRRSYVEKHQLKCKEVEKIKRLC